MSGDGDNSLGPRFQSVCPLQVLQGGATGACHWPTFVLLRCVPPQLSALERAHGALGAAQQLHHFLQAHPKHTQQKPHHAVRCTLNVIVYILWTWATGQGSIAASNAMIVIGVGS